MSRQTIFAHVPEEERAQQVISVAAAIARRDHSHLIAGYAIPPVTVHPMVGELPQVVYDGHFQMYSERAAQMEAKFNDATRGDAFVAEWRTLDSGASPLADVLMDHARCADLVVAAHYGPGGEKTAYNDVTETLAMESGRPVLMLPKHMIQGSVGEHITVAWDGSRESVRAVFDAVDLLKDAKSVRILSVGDAPTDGKSPILPAAEMAATLARRGIPCEADYVIRGDVSIGDAILGRVADMGSDMLVMGFYGHSKLREFVFGGVTRHILNHMTIPVLMSR